MRSFNKRQREGLAKIADNLATASLVTGIIGGVVDQKLLLWQIVVLVVLFCSFAATGVWLKRAEGDDDE